MWRRTWLVFSQAVTVALGLLFVLLTLKPEWLPRPAVGGVLPAPTLVQMVPAPATAASGVETGDARILLSMAAAARRASPAVASVTAVHGAGPGDPRNPFGRDLSRSPQLGLGSAVIVAPEGYLLTNHHVVDGAVDIEVQLADGRHARARLVGSDLETDIALLKIEMDNLPVVTLGDSTSLQVGDAVLAIGNPFNVGQTVTSGIVSALDRDRQTESPFQSFIQTDAAINLGNSGGALVDAHGALVGINTAIFSRDGTSLGIGFAVPVDTARLVMEALLRDGQVRRGWLGVQQRTLTPDLADALNLPVKQGALIVGVLQDGPAARAGLRPGDVVTRVSDRPVLNINELLAAVAMLAPESQTMLTVYRGTEELQLPVRLGQRPPTPRRRG
jgi:Do/DeqQ family serine protease